MAVTVSAVAAVFAPIIPTTNLVTATITATADADTTTGNVAHGLSYTPTFAIITPIQPQGALKAWAWVSASTTGTNIVFTGNNVTGSGVAGASVQVWFGRLHSIVC